MILLKKINKEKELISTIIIVITYNSEQYIEELIKSLINQDYDISNLLLLIIDNNSQDGTVNKIFNIVSKLSHNYRTPNILLIKLTRNVGFAPANNLGLKLLKKLGISLRGKNIIFLNPDISILDRKFLNIVEKLLTTLPIIGFAMRSWRDSNVIDSLGGYIDALGSPQEILHGIRLLGKIKASNSLPLIYAIPSACFAAIAIRGNVFEIIGFLKDWYVMYFEDVEFCLRAWSTGIPVYLYRKFVVQHARGGTQRTSTSEITAFEIVYHISKNSLLLSYEYLGPLVYLIKAALYLAISLIYKKKLLVHSFLESIHIIKKKKLKWRRLPKGLIPHDPRTWAFLWAFKYWLRYGGATSIALSYGARRASIEYVLHYLIPKYRFRQKIMT